MKTVLLQDLDDWQKRLLAIEPAGSFKAFGSLYFANTAEGKIEGRTFKAFVSPSGLRWEYLDLQENQQVVHLLLSEGKRRTFYRLYPAKRTAEIVETYDSGGSPGGMPKQQAQRFQERYRGFWCVREEWRERSMAASLGVLLRGWTVSAGPARGWLLRLELHMQSANELLGFAVWDTLDVSFESLPRELFVLPRDYQIVK
jgi:hypothetical protein